MSKFDYVFKQYLNVKYFFKQIKAIFSIFIKKVLFKKKTLWHKYFYERLGMYPKSLTKQLKNKKIILFCGYSAGELFGFENFCEKLKNTYPDHDLVLSVTDFDSYKTAKKIKVSKHIIFLPWDLKFCVTRMLQQLNIKLTLFVGILTHPIVTKILYKKSKVGLINGLKNIDVVKIKQKKYRKDDDLRSSWCYHNQIYKDADFLFMVDNKSKKVLKGITNVEPIVLGSVERYGKTIHSTKKEILLLKQKLTLKNKTIIAGPLENKEDEFVLDAVNKIKKYSSFNLILVPRHVNQETIMRIEKNAKLRNFNTVRYSKIKSKIQLKDTVIIFDVFGKLASLYHLANIVILGGSLKGPATHNIYEPSMCKKPIILGKNPNNYEEDLQPIQKKYSFLFVENSDELATALKKLLDDPKLIKEIGSFYYNQAFKEKYPTNKYVTEIKKIYPPD